MDVATFKDTKDRIGLLASEPEEQSFFMLSQPEVKDINLEESAIEITVMLRNTRKGFERQAFTFFALLGNVGGFNAAIVMLAAYPMSFISERMF